MKNYRVILVGMLFVVSFGCGLALDPSDIESLDPSSNGDDAGQSTQNTDDESDTATDSDADTGQSTGGDTSGDTGEEDDGVLDWVEISGGSFQMGGAGGDEAPIHAVEIDGFEMTETEITVAQYRLCHNSGDCSAASSFEGCFSEDGPFEDRPRNCVNWLQARSFCLWAGGDLPSEAMWEFAASSRGLRTPYPWGALAPTCQYLVMGGCQQTEPQKVCSLTMGNTIESLCDMGGNVREWVLDWYHDSYVGAPADGSAWEDPVGSIRIVRGGDYEANGSNARVNDRAAYVPDSERVTTGFRCVR